VKYLRLVINKWKFQIHYCVKNCYKFVQFLEYEKLTTRMIDLDTALHVPETKSLTAKRCGNEVVGELFDLTEIK